LSSHVGTAEIRSSFQPSLRDYFIVTCFPGLASWAKFRVAPPPDFLWNSVALANFMRLSLQKGARAASSSDAWQEIRVRGWICKAQLSR
jgi:hypothetical protein